MATYPVLRYRDARAAIDWLQRAFGLSTKEVHADEAGTIVHAELADEDGGLVMIGSEREGGGGDDDEEQRAGRGWLYVAVNDPDALYERAVAAGARIDRELADTDYGSRDFAARDLEGNLWSFGSYRP